MNTKEKPVMRERYEVQVCARNCELKFSRSQPNPLVSASESNAWGLILPRHFHVYCHVIIRNRLIFCQQG